MRLPREVTSDGFIWADRLGQPYRRFPEIKSRMYPAALAALNRQDMEDMNSLPLASGRRQRLPVYGYGPFDELYQVTLGMPREIVKVCDLALLRSFTDNRHEVELVDVVEAATELGLRSA